ncbi:MAG: hypothetical protein Q9166_007734 [cf. Caloplaca sp. 2 TL-2023]
MSGKATAGFADLRAKFENKNDSSPPSRGRSPAGKENVTGSGRKIRTSFISVERSGQMGPSIDQRESTGSNDDQTSVAGGANELQAGVNGEEMGIPKTNGIAVAVSKQGEPQQPVNEQNGPATTNNASNGTLEQDEATKTDAVNPDKPATTGEEDAPSMLPSDPKDETAVSGGAALAPKGESLGTLLKGSDFEPEKVLSKMSSPKKSFKKVTAPRNPSTPVKKSRETPKSTPAKAVGTSNMNGTSKVKPGSARSPTVTKPQTSSLTKPTKTSRPTAEDSSVPISTVTPTSPVSTPQQPLQKTASPKQPLQSEDVPQPSKKDQKKPAVQKISRLSTNTKPTKTAAPAATKPSTSTTAGLTKRSGPNSPITNKPKPRSPTRPVRLPAAATASTAASSAKTGSTVPPRPESRAGVSNPIKSSAVAKPTVSKAPPKTTAANLRSRAPRSSLPASIHDQKPKPKPRTSTPSTKAPGNDFLSRMMRPTQSSANKTHEKVEQKTPPKKRISPRPKRISDENDESPKGKSAEAGASPEQELKTLDEPPIPVQPATNQDDVAQELTEEAPVEKVPELDVNKSTSDGNKPIAVQ